MRLHRFVGRRGFLHRVHGIASRAASRSQYLTRLRLEPLEDRRLLNGVTLIAHGGIPVPSSGPPSWTSAMVDAVNARTPDPSNTSIWTLEVTGGSPEVNAVTNDAGPNRFTEDYNGESIIKLDWSDALDYTTTEVASTVADYLLTTVIEGKTWLDAPLHLIGHSRGTSIVSALAKELGKAGIWVDQVTYLDPCPSPIPRDYGFAWGDTFSETVTNNVAFADNYMHREAYSPNGLVDLLGKHVVGTHEYCLDDLTGGYSEEGAGHQNMHLWYHGTIQTSDPISDGEVSDFYADANGWYSDPFPSRLTSGFSYSRIGGGQRPSDGVSDLLGGEGSRQSVDLSSAVWPNVIEPALVNPNSQVTQGDTFCVNYGYQDYDSEATVTFFLDVDQNPYNGNEIQGAQKDEAQTGGTSLAWDSQSVSTAAVPEGTYKVFAKITDGAHTRYLYVPGNITVQVVTSSFPGDANNDGVVNADDAAILAANWGKSDKTWADGDFNNDGVVNAADASILAANWGATWQVPMEEQPTAPSESHLIGPRPASGSSVRHRLIEPIARGENAKSMIMAAPVGESSPNTTEATHDAVLAKDETYEPKQQTESSSRDHQRLAWSCTMARRNRSSHENNRLKVNSLAVELLFADD